MARIVNEKRRVKKFSPSKWTTDVVWNPEVADEEDDEQRKKKEREDLIVI